ncbi:hypothetical protein V1477_017989 [Vespula maculifrons]|uniref:Uncharacterized protein n=2 Tax=Vespula TaxID=7451 RepID=A0A834NG81_VESVU|nr:hypothetical protein HZH66_002704 [Vespula vulgaris]
MAERLIRFRSGIAPRSRPFNHSTPGLDRCPPSATNWHGINETGSSYMKRDETTQDKARRRSSFKVSMKDPCSCPVVQRPYHLKAEPYTHLNTTDHGESFAKNQFAQLGGSSLIW